ncbi:MAG TPA: FHA domain-containing protein [Acidimicrobiales bacterium]|nr:FHA domain-containing protein [Acidimicrobiales bacterium]
MLLLTSLDNQNLLRGLEIIVVALIWLFFFRVIRAVWVEVRPPKARRKEAEVLEPAGAAPAQPQGRRQRSRNLQLKIMEPDPQKGRTYELADELTLGRAAGCGVRVEDAYTSSIHARLYRRDGTLWVEDLGSTNGTWVNAQRIGSPTRLGKGDLLQVGGTVFEVSR